MSSVCKFSLLAFIPIIVALIFRILWFITPKSYLVFIALFTMIFNFLINPIFLIGICNYITNNKKKNMLICIPICFVVNIGSIYIQYWNWNSSMRSLTRPDSTSVMTLQIQLVVSSVVLIIGLLVIALLKAIKNK